MSTVLGIGAMILAIACLLDLPRAQRINQNLAGYFLVNGQLKLPGFVAAILSANLSIGNFLIFITAWGFLFGWAGIFWFLVNLVLNVVAYLVFIPAFRGYIEDRTNSGTLHEFLSSRFSQDVNARRIRLVASATTILGLLFAIVFELHLAADIMARLLHVDVVLIFALLTALICVYSGMGGFHTLVFTDWVQSIVMIAGGIALAVILIGLNGLTTTKSVFAAYPLTWSALDIGWPNILGICVVGSGWFLVAMDQWQRACATRDASRTKSGMFWYLFIISAFALVFGLLGVFDKTAILPALSADLLKQSSEGVNPLQDLFVVLAIPNIGIEAGIWQLLYGLVALALLAAAMSTANTFLIVSGHSFVSDLLIAVAKGSSLHLLQEQEERIFLAVARGSIVGMGIFVIGAWFLLNSLKLLTDPLSFFFIAYSIQFALLAPMICARLPPRWQPTGEGVFHSIWIGVIVSLLWSLGWWRLPADIPPFLGAAPADWVALTPVITLLVGSIVLAVSARRRPTR
jgi:Na+/proline symporter